MDIPPTGVDGDYCLMGQLVNNSCFSISSHPQVQSLQILWASFVMKIPVSSSSLIPANIDHFLAKLVSEALLTAHAATSYGKDPDKVYGLAQCRGAVSSNDCSSCIQDAAKQIRQHCPNQADARIWYVHCFYGLAIRNWVEELTNYSV
ncbi:hypothetical protein CRYUN_Cryun20dG0100200 [Craigia yunnanensis]